MEYLDFGTPISFGYTAQYLPQKSVTRRDWKDSHATKFIKAFDRATAEGKKLRLPAIDKAYHAGGKQIGWLILSHAPYKEALKNMTHADLTAEGGMCTTVGGFVAKYFKGDLEKEVWVVGFKFQHQVDELESDRRELLAQVAELESDRRELLAQVAELQMQLAKKSESASAAREIDPIDWLNHDICEQVETAERRLRELEIDRELLPDDIYARQRCEWQTKLEILKYTQRAIAKINTRYTAEYQAIINREHPLIEEESGYTPNFAPNRLVESSPETGNLLIKIEKYQHTQAGWIAQCNVRISQRAPRDSKLLILADELFADFHPWQYTKTQILPQYSLGSIRTAKGLKSHFPGIDIPAWPRADSSELTASDGSIWQAFVDGDYTGRSSIKWRCEVLPDGFSRSPRIDIKNDRTESVAIAKTFY